MDLPTVLLRMLTSACENDQLKNWSVYEERDGNYTFKIRFMPKEYRHIEVSSSQVQGKNQQSAYKRKSDNQIARDKRRSEERKNRAITRSQSAKIINSTPGEGSSNNPVEESIETMRHISIQNVQSLFHIL